MPDTSMSRAFEKAGFYKRQMRLYRPLIEFKEADGTEEELLAVWAAVVRQPGEGQKSHADEAREEVPLTRHPETRDCPREAT